ncbi:DEAD/DEAH box helicase family protein [Aliarcobacter lanthieri]|uniref:DEAD/DEAH box helicase family protein n=1 Tax=Aliarcobacter lanthieri TaxID=1355374 RepID=UPI003AA82992
MSNFLFLKNEFEILASDCIKSESNVLDDPEVSAFYARKALEKSIKFIYEIDEDLDEKLLNELSTFELITHHTFADILPVELINELHIIRKIGNSAVHSKHNITINSKDSLNVNKCLYKFQKWIVEVYSNYEVNGNYDDLNIKKPKFTKEQKRTKREKVYTLEGLSEAQTREILIDLELREAGYKTENFTKKKDIEYKLTLENGDTGYADYVIWDEDDTPLAVIEAKKYSKSLSAGKYQAQLYAQALSKKFDKDVLIFVTNGKIIEYSNGVYPFREIHSFFPKNELKRILQQKKAIQNNKPSTYTINENITDRTYQKRVIKSVLKEFELYKTRALLVMATGTGKTRVSASLSDVLIKSDWVRKVLFLADRVELVKQAKNNFNEYLSETCTNLGDEKDLDSRMHFGTYETVHNLIKNGEYNSAYFDLIIVDEAHRTIYKKYKAIFEYFDAFILGLTATPTQEVHRNTYEFFQTGDKEPTDSYSLDTAIKDGNLVPFKAKEIDLGIVKRGIKYNDLSDEEKEEYESKFEEDEKEISSNEINERVLNKETNEEVLKKLHSEGLKINDGNKLGKTIIFARNKKHAEYIKEIFDLLYPHRTKEAEIIHSEISHKDTLMDNFKNPNRNPQIAISVDMLDTGIDIPEILNLVFFKPVKSKTKFWQMIGRGTRLCPNLLGDGINKREFYIFDFGMNFTYFGLTPEGMPSSKTTSLQERLFLKRVGLIRILEEGEFKKELVSIVKTQVDNLDLDDYRLKKHRFIIEELQTLDLNIITDKVYEDLKTISDYIEDNTKFETQRFQMEILNAEELSIKEKDNKNYIESLQERCKILKSKANTIHIIKNKIDIIDKVLENKYDFSNINDLEIIRKELENIADLSIDKGNNNPVKTNFRDEILEIKEHNSSDFVDKASIQTEIQKRLKEYLDNLVLIQQLEKSDLITSLDIESIKHYVFDIEKNIKDKLEENSDFETLLKDIINSTDKQVANKILDNFISLGNYSQKQIELITRIKNIVFEKQYINIGKAVSSIKDILGNENHSIYSQFYSLSAKEQDDIVDVVKFIEKLEAKVD